MNHTSKKCPWKTVWGLALTPPSSPKRRTMRFGAGGRSPKNITVWPWTGTHKTRRVIPVDLEEHYHTPHNGINTQNIPIPFVSDLCGVDVQWFQERSSQALPHSKELSSVNDFRFPVGFQELLQALLCFLRRFCSTRMRLDLLCGQVLHHDCISVIRDPHVRPNPTLHFGPFCVHHWGG